jgi:hypothetical protein
LQPIATIPAVEVVAGGCQDESIGPADPFGGAAIAIMSGTLIQSPSCAEPGAKRRTDAWQAAAVCGLLVLAVLLVFSRTLSQGFLNIDDSYFVYN